MHLSPDPIYADRYAGPVRRTAPPGPLAVTSAWSALALLIACDRSLTKRFTKSLSDSIEDSLTIERVDRALSK
jgi:hypothetical protein